MIEKVKNEVKKLLENDESGHDFNHTERVLNLALKFSKDYEIDKTKLSLIALLRDVDDYKLVGLENSLKLSNATLILENINFDKKLSKEI